MSDNIEAQTTTAPEKTPAEIAAELEKKATLLDVEGKKQDAARKRALAKQVREVESSTVTGTTEIKLQALQAKRPPLEKKDLEEAKSATEAVTTVAGIAVAAKAVSDKIDDSGLGHLGIKDGIKDWIKEAVLDEPGEDAGFFDKIMHKLKMFFLLPLAKVFGVDLTKKKEGEVKEDKKSGVDAKQEESKAKIDTFSSDQSPRYIATRKVLQKFFVPKSNVNGTEIFNNNLFITSSLDQIQTIYTEWKNGKDLKKTFGIDNKSVIKASDIQATLAIMADPTSKRYKLFHDQCRKSIGEDYKKMTMKEIFEKVSPSFAYLNTFSNIDITEWNLDEILGDVWFEINEKWEISGSLSDKVTSSFSPKMRNNMFVTYADTLFQNKETGEKWIQTLPPGMEDSEKQEYLKIFEFGEKFQNEVISNPHVNLWMGAEFKKMFSEKWISFFGLASLYALLGGNCDYESMTAIEKLTFYSACGKLAWDFDSYDKGAFGGRYLAELQNVNSPNIPKEIKDLANDFVLNIGEKASNWVAETLKQMFGFVVNNPQTGIAIILWGFLLGKVRRKSHKWTHH